VCEVNSAVRSRGHLKEVAVHYIVPRNPSSSALSLHRLQARARHAGYRVLQDRGTGTFSLVDARLNLPLLGLDRVELIEIARAIVALVEGGE
jgi:hypothetical protein